MLHNVVSKKFLLPVLFIGFYSNVFSQKVDTSYSFISYDEVWAYEKQSVKSTWYWGSFEGYIFSEIMGFLKEKKESSAKLDILTKTWNDNSTYPQKITDGWHNAIVTDNVNYYRVVKILVSNNRPTKFVVDNWLPIRFIAANEIKNGRITVTLENHNSESLEIAELYFLYDLQEPTLTSEPQHPGYVCFWSDLKDYKTINLKIDDLKIRKPFIARLVGDNDCGTEGMVCKILKPGIHEYKASGVSPSGPWSHKRTFRIKEDMCLHYRLGEKKRAKK